MAGNDSKLMGRLDPVTGELGDIRKRSYAEYNGDPDLVDVAAHPDVSIPVPHGYDSGTKTAIQAPSSVSVLPVEITVDPSGTGQVSVALSGPNNAVVSLSYDGALPIDKDQYTLSPTGEATVYFDQGTKIRSSKPVRVCFRLSDGSEAGHCELTVNLKTP